jgi:hypothetical protein
MDENSVLWERIQEAYSPFEVSNSEFNHKDGRFTVYIDRLKFVSTLDEDLACWKQTLVYSNKGDVIPGFIELSIYKSDRGHYFEFTQPWADDINGYLCIDDSLECAQLYLRGNERQQYLTLNTGLNFCYLLATSSYNTVLTHASCVIYKGKAYLFLGRSGTGKSTHSRMWMSALEGVELMNDDHPVVRIEEDGTAIAYGSPWSGKTKCYKNVQAPIGGIVRISRAPYNRVSRLSVIESYASLVVSCSGMTWEKGFADGRDATIQQIIKSVTCWVMECLPNEEAARVCSEGVSEV